MFLFIVVIRYMTSCCLCVGSPSRLTNADFRKLLMTPRAGPAGGSSATPAATPAAARPEIPGKIDKAEERRKKKRLVTMPMIELWETCIVECECHMNARDIIGKHR